MLKNAVIWTVAVAMLSTGTAAEAEPSSTLLARPLAVAATPLKDSGERATVRLARASIDGQAAVRRFSKKKCAAGLAIGTAGGAALGLGAAVAMLVSSGGSDSAGAIMKGFSGFGGMAGIMIGGIAGCR